MAKKDKKKKEEKHESPESEIQDEQLMATTNLEPVEDIQYTDTSYTSASFESLPPVIEEFKPKKKKGKKKAEEAVEEVVKKTSSELFQWSEEELPSEEEKIKIEEEEKRVKKKKGKKGKKEKEDIPVFEKPKNWRKMNKKEREAWMLQRIEEWRAEKEAEKQAILAGAKEKRATLARERAELLAKDNAEQETRRDILAKTVNLFHKFEKQKFDLGRNKQLQDEWQQYLRCDGLPDPRVVTQMNTYIHLWRESGDCDDDELDRRCKEALPMLEMLEDFLANSRQYTPLQVQSYNEVRLALREQLSNAIQCASFTLLRDLRHRLQWDTIKMASYEREFKELRLNLWVAVPLPTRKPKPVEPEREPVELAFPSMKVSVKLPKTIDGSKVCVRAARSMIDLLSESSRTFALKTEIPNRYEDLFIFNVKEHIATYKLKKEQDDIRNKFYKEIRDKIKEIEAFLKANPYTKNEKEKEELDNLNMAEPQGLPDPRTFIAEQNELAFAKYLKTCMTRTRTGEVNLRKYRICSGVLNLDLLMTPPQPKQIGGGIYMTTLELPKRLQPMKYQVQYRAPSPPPPGVTRTPEEIEAELKKVETQYEKLALVCIDLPQDVMWTEPPVICQWQEARNLWTSNYVNDYKFNEDKLTVQFRTGVLLMWTEHPVICQWQEARNLWTSNYVNDYKFNEDKLTVQFRTGVLWPIGIAALRYGNMPYQGWDVRPDPNGKGVLVSVTGVCVTVTWLCVGNYVQLKWIANATTSALKEHFNKKYSVKKMIQIMREAACDMFPDFDAHNHIEGTNPKEWVMERHNYHAMAFLSRAYHFQWSRWNVSAGSRNIIMQIREAVDKKREAKFQLLHVTPQRANILKCIELSQEFNTEPLMGLQFYPDLFTLNMSYGSVDARRATFNMKFRLVETVFDLLQELKLSSFS